jgi:hypothetical protein
MRTGDEPVHARSPLRLRLALASFGVLCAISGTVVFMAVGSAGGAIACIVLGVVALADGSIVIMRIRQGPHYQPGPTTPPYRPVEETRRQPDKRRRAP